MGWEQRIREQEPGSTETVQIFISVRLPAESAHALSIRPNIEGGGSGVRAVPYSLRAMYRLARHESFSLTYLRLGMIVHYPQSHSSRDCEQEVH